MAYYHIARNFVRYPGHIMLLGWSNQGGYNGKTCILVKGGKKYRDLAGKSIVKWPLGSSGRNARIIQVLRIS